MQVHFSSAKQDWRTPRPLFSVLDAEFGFTLDAAASHDNALCPRYFTLRDNALIQDWTKNADGGAVWCNPPYRSVERWIEKAATEAKRGATVVMLIPARTDTKAWHRCIFRRGPRGETATRPGVEVRFLEGRVAFGGGQSGNSAPFPSAIVVFRPPEAHVGVGARPPRPPHTLPPRKEAIV